MSNSMKLLARTLIILVLMVAGSWLNGQLAQINSSTGDFRWVPIAAMYAVYLLIGVTIGTVANPRFTKAKNKWVYVLPILIFAVIGAHWFLSPFFSVASLPLGIGAHLMQFSYLSWTVVGFFLNLASR